MFGQGKKKGSQICLFFSCCGWFWPHPLLRCASRSGGGGEFAQRRLHLSLPATEGPTFWKLVFCFVSSHALDSNSYVESKKKPKPHQVRKTGSLKPLEDGSVLCAAPGVAFVQEVVGGFDFLLPRDDGKIIVGTWKLRAVFFTVWDRELWNSVNINFTRDRAMFLLGCSATVFLSCSSSDR